MYIKVTISLFLIALFVLLWHRERTSLKIRHYNIYIKDLPPDFEGFQILHLSDLHSKYFGDNQEKLIGLLKNCKYDIIALTGDFTDKHIKDSSPFIRLLERLPEGKKYFVRGNHEWRVGFDVDKLADLGVEVLDNKADMLTRGNSQLWVLGVDDPHTGRDRLDVALDGIGQGVKVLLAHSPNIFPRAISCGVDLVLAGHTHGGQVRLPFIGAVIAPGQGFLPRWDYGLYREKDTSMVINPGLGESDLPIRINIRPEVGIVVLK